MSQENFKDHCHFSKDSSFQSQKKGQELAQGHTATGLGWMDQHLLLSREAAMKPFPPKDAKRAVHYLL